ncbi:uncharacterized protein DEA37_0011133 [Paragonimus westermani]|uniref:Uncharacterized protein n=1 Tax=Paragonimus westermani TaxID=34504 RepID=A0A5J4NUK2_9TREM|nr:uncharacterized protein DEA37_0011133 [Paragonimus westermani]
MCYVYYSSAEHQDHNGDGAQPPLGDAEARESNSASPAELVILSEKSEEGACKNAHSWVMQAKKYYQLLNLLQSLDVILSGLLFHCGTPLKFPEVGAELPFKEMEAEICEQIRSKLSEVPELAEAILSVSVQSLTKTESGGIKAKIHVRYDAAKLKQYENPCDLVEVHRSLKFHLVINGMAETPHSSLYARPIKQEAMFYTHTTIQLHEQNIAILSRIMLDYSYPKERNFYFLSCEVVITNALSSDSMFVVNKVTCELKEAVEAGESQLNAVICLQLGGTEVMNSMSKEDLIKSVRNLVFEEGLRQMWKERHSILQFTLEKA